MTSGIRRTGVWGLGLGLAAWLGLGLGATWAMADSPTLELRLGPHRLQAEVAHTPAQRAKGLMERTSLAENSGMLFVFPNDDQHCMWMKNTPLPLAVAFIDATGRIVNMAEMTPFSLDIHCASHPVRYALETPSGWFAKRHIRPGHALTGLDTAPTGR